MPVHTCAHVGFATERSRRGTSFPQSQRARRQAGARRGRRRRCRRSSRRWSRTASLPPAEYERRRQRALDTAEAARSRSTTRCASARPSTSTRSRICPTIDCASIIPICKARCCTLTVFCSAQDLDERVVQVGLLAAVSHSQARGRLLRALRAADGALRNLRASGPRSAAPTIAGRIGASGATSTSASWRINREARALALVAVVALAGCLTPPPPAENDLAHGAHRRRRPPVAAAGAPTPPAAPLPATWPRSSSAAPSRCPPNVKGDVTVWIVDAPCWQAGGRAFIATKVDRRQILLRGLRSAGHADLGVRRRR